MAFEGVPFCRAHGRPRDGEESKPSSRASLKVFAMVVAAVAVLVVLTDTDPFADDAVTPANPPAENQQSEPTR